MLLTESEMLRRLGAGWTIASVCEAAEIDGADFDRWWRETIHRRTPTSESRPTKLIDAKVEIARDRWGIPHIFAESDRDLFFGFGFAMAQDRLFQLDYLRRKGLGRLAEILGDDGLESDKIARTVGLNRIAAAEWSRLPKETRTTLESFSAGINELISQRRDALPVEFALLDYQPAEWTPIDCLAIESEFRWYLTGRFPVIVIPELAKRRLSQGPLYQDAITGEADEEPILWPGEYASGRSVTDQGRSGAPVGEVVADPDAAQGSNNWVIAPGRSVSKSPLLANDPHIAFEAVSCWYEAHLCGGSFNVVGMAYAGIPAIMVGRNQRVAWGITNNICSQRDLYQEKTDPSHSGCFQFDGEWEESSKLTEVIEVRDAPACSLTVQFSRNGPVVDEILPTPARSTGPVTLKWLGAEEGGWLTSMLRMDRADSVEQFRQSVEPWHVPTFNLVVADVDGHIALQSAGRIPIRASYERGYRDGSDPLQQWKGLIPFAQMPHLVDPDRQWIATANNRVSADDFPYLLSGCWASGWRARRIREMIEDRPRLTVDDLRAMHHDTKSLRAAALVPDLLAILDGSSGDFSAAQREALAALRAWDCHVERASVGATIFNVFFDAWCFTVASERFDEPEAAFVAGGLQGCAGRLLRDDRVGWFENNDRLAQVVATFVAAVTKLAKELGPDAADWTWEKWHTMPLRHVLSARGDLSSLLDHGGQPVTGDATTVCNTGCLRDGAANAGAGYRMIADLASSPPVLLASDCQSQSGNPGSKHYADQFSDWASGDYHPIPVDGSEARSISVSFQELLPQAR